MFRIYGLQPTVLQEGGQEGVVEDVPCRGSALGPQNWARAGGE